MVVFCQNSLVIKPPSHHPILLSRVVQCQDDIICVDFKLTFQNDVNFVRPSSPAGIFETENEKENEQSNGHLAYTEA